MYLWVTSFLYFMKTHLCMLAALPNIETGANLYVSVPVMHPCGALKTILYLLHFPTILGAWWVSWSVCCASFCLSWWKDWCPTPTPVAPNQEVERECRGNSCCCHSVSKRETVCETVIYLPIPTKTYSCVHMCMYEYGSGMFWLHTMWCLLFRKKELNYLMLSFQSQRRSLHK